MIFQCLVLTLVMGVRLNIVNRNSEIVNKKLGIQGILLFPKELPDSSKDFLFFFPEELKLPKNKPINQQNDLIEWQDQKQVQNRV